MLDKNTIEEILKIKGEARGAVFQTDASYVLGKEGEAGLEKFKVAIAQTGQPIKYGKEVKATGWYPLSWRVISLMVIKDVFNWDDQEITKMGLSAPKHSFIVKTLLRYFVSLEKTFTESSKYWREHYSIGELHAPEIDIKGKRLVIQLKNFKVHPILCVYFMGYFKAITGLVVRSEDMNIIEDKCSFKGDSYHQFTISWK